MARAAPVDQIQLQLQIAAEVGLAALMDQLQAQLLGLGAYMAAAELVEIWLGMVPEPLAQFASSIPRPGLLAPSHLQTQETSDA
jgi:hypothetical protein